MKKDLDYYEFFYHKNKRRILRYFGNKNPFTTVTEVPDIASPQGVR